MAMQRNNIAARYSRRRKAELVRWREVEGLMPGQIAVRAAREWPGLPPIHGTTWAAWSRSPEYRELRDTVCGEARRSEKLDALWGAVESGGMDTALQGTLYLLLHQAFESAQGGELETKELTALVNSLSTAQRAEIARTAEARNAELDRLRAEHAAALAERDAEIATLRAELDALRNPQQDDSALSEEERVKRIRERLGVA